MRNIIIGYRKYSDEKLGIYEHEFGFRYRGFFIGISWVTDMPDYRPSGWLAQRMEDLPVNATEDEFFERLVEIKKEVFDEAFRNRMN